MCGGTKGKIGCIQKLDELGINYEIHIVSVNNGIWHKFCNLVH